MALANQTLKRFQGTFLKKVADITFHVSLRVKLAFLCKINGRFDIRSDTRKYKQSLSILSLVRIMQTNEKSDLGCAKALTELIL